MSSSDPGQHPVRLVTAAAEGTEIFVIDGKYRRVASALNRLDIALPAGLYSVKFKRGGIVAEVDADLLPHSGTVTIPAPSTDLAFASAAPIDQTFTSHEYHQAAATAISRSQPEDCGWGQGSQLFVFFRDVENKGLGNPAAGLTLHDQRGRMVADLGARGETGNIEHTAGASWHGCNLELAPGSYRLRLSRAAQSGLEQSLTLSPGWQLQVFGLRTPQTDPSAMPNPGGSAGSIDLTAATLFMAESGRGFDPWDGTVQLTELARKGLEGGRMPITESDLMAKLQGKFHNPVLGLFAAHLLLPLLLVRDMRGTLTDPKIRRISRAIQTVLGTVVDGIIGPKTLHLLRSLLDQVLGNLESLLGPEHPDVQAVRSELTGQSPCPTAGRDPVLPMFYRSWQTLVRQAPDYRQAAPNSLSERIADRLWGSGPWLVWQVPPVALARKMLDPAEFGNTLSRLSQRCSTAAELTALLEGAGLNAVEESALRHSLHCAGLEFQRREEKTITSQSPKTSTPIEAIPLEVAIGLGMPVTTVERNLASASHKVVTLLERPPHYPGP